jgi:hypothetical protein
MDSFHSLAYSDQGRESILGPSAASCAATSAYCIHGASTGAKCSGSLCSEAKSADGSVRKISLCVRPFIPAAREETAKKIGKISRERISSEHKPIAAACSEKKDGGDPLERHAECSSSDSTCIDSVSQHLRSPTDGVILNVRLRTVENAPVRIRMESGIQSALQCLLQEPGCESVVVAVGDEIFVSRRPVLVGSIDITRSQLYFADNGRRCINGRYIMRERGSKKIVGAIKFVTSLDARQRDEVMLTSVVVHPAFRRKGIAARMLEEIMSDYPQVRVRSLMTPMGAAFFRYLDWQHVAD